MRTIRDIRDCFSVDEDDVKLYINQNYEPNAIYDDTVIFDYVQRNHNPEDVFPDRDLDYWAAENGYTKGEQK